MPFFVIEILNVEMVYNAKESGQFFFFFLFYSSFLFVAMYVYTIVLNYSIVYVVFEFDSQFQ